MAAAINRIPLEEALSANSWNGRTIFSTGRTRFTPMDPSIPRRNSTGTMLDIYSSSCLEKVFSETQEGKRRAGAVRWGCRGFRTGWVCYDTYITGPILRVSSTASIKAGSLRHKSQHPGLFSCSQPRHVLRVIEGLARRSYKGKPAAEGGSTAGQYRQCTYEYGFAKVALQDVVALLEDRSLLEPLPLSVFPPPAFRGGPRRLRLRVERLLRG